MTAAICCSSISSHNTCPSFPLHVDTYIHIYPYMYSTFGNQRFDMFDAASPAKYDCKQLSALQPRGIWKSRPVLSNVKTSRDCDEIGIRRGFIWLRVIWRLWFRVQGVASQLRKSSPGRTRVRGGLRTLWRADTDVLRLPGRAPPAQPEQNQLHFPMGPSTNEVKKLGPNDQRPQ